jgi:DoxX
MSTDHQRGPMNETVRYGLLPLVARLLIVAEFLVAVIGKISGWDDQAAYMASRGMHFIPPLLGAALAIELLGSICLITGFQARRAAGIMFVYPGDRERGTARLLEADRQRSGRQPDGVLQEPRDHGGVVDDRRVRARALGDWTARGWSSRGGVNGRADRELRGER